MKLRYSPTSPYVRKVTVTAIETGLDKRIERIFTMPASAPDLPNDNPLGKVPALIMDNGEPLIDLPVIVDISTACIRARRSSRPPARRGGRR